MPRATALSAILIGVTLFVALHAASPGPGSESDSNSQSTPNSSGDDESQPCQEPKDKKQPMPRLTDYDIEVLEAIRQQLGTSPLKGPLWNGELAEGIPRNDRTFAGQLRDQFGGAERKRTQPPWAHSANDQTGRLYERSLRSLSRRLDAIAHDMEELRLYDQADHARELGKQIRDQIQR